MLNRRHLWVSALLAMAGFAPGCGGGDGEDGLNTLVTVTPVAPGASCPAGGVQIRSGLDVSGDGTLDADEATGSELVCAGESASQALIVQTDLAVGDANCPNGGVQTDVGLDTNGNDALDSGEVTDTAYVCDGTNLYTEGSLTPPTGAAGSSTLNTSGGVGATAGGGDGGDVEIYFDYGSLGGHVKVFTTGSVDTSFTTPTVAGYFGDEPLVVSTDLTVTTLPDADTSGLSANEIFQYSTSERLYRWSGTEAVQITGVDVAAGATLTLGFLTNYGGARLRTTDTGDVRVAGTLTTERQSGSLDGTALYVYAHNVIVTATGVVDTSGADAASGSNGGNAGRLDLDANIDSGSGSVVLAGTLRANGGAGDAGGSGGTVQAGADGHAYNSGTFESRGGVGSVSSGGGGGALELYGAYGGAFNSGSFHSEGGQGATLGGAGGSIELYVDYVGDLVNSGDLVSAGGSAAASCVANCGGGAGGDVEIYAYGGGVFHSATIDTRGGSGAAGTGGSGGDVEIYNEYYDEPWETETVAPGNIELSGNMLLQGGAGASGGTGGGIEIYLDADYAPRGQELILYGYSAIIASGGAGVTSGGSGGDIDIFNDYADSDTLDYGPGGSVVNYATLTTVGGAASAGGGGSGGDVDLYTDEEYGYAVDFQWVYSYGDIDTTGGAGTSSGGEGGDVDMYGFNGVLSEGLVTQVGGAASAAAGVGGEGGYFYLVTDVGDVTVSGDVDCTGGAAIGAGATAGDGDGMEIYGRTVTISANLSSAGGAANLTDGQGGDGDDIYVAAWSRTPASVTGAINTAGGAGFTPGTAGLGTVGPVTVSGPGL